MPDHFDHLQLEAGVEHPSFLLVCHVFRFRGDFHLSGCLGKLDHYRESNEDSRRRLELQGFETILFQLLASHNAILSELDIQMEPGGPVLARGRDCFHRYYTRHLKPAYKRLRNTSSTSEELTLSLSAWESVWLRHRHNLGHYLRFIYNIFRYVDEAQIPEVAKRKYSRIIRSQLSDYELLILFYNCLHQNGIERFKPLVEKYALFNNLPIELLLAEEHVAFYATTAFETVGISDA